MNPITSAIEKLVREAIGFDTGGQIQITLTEGGPTLIVVSDGNDYGVFHELANGQFVQLTTQVVLEGTYQPPVPETGIFIVGLDLHGRATATRWFIRWGKQYYTGDRNQARSWTDNVQFALSFVSQTGARTLAREHNIKLAN